MTSRSHARPVIVHVSSDFPDPVGPDKTRAIRSLVDLTADNFDHRVYSLNRRRPALRDLVQRDQNISSRGFEYGQAITYRAPGKGILHASLLARLGDWLAGDLLSRGIKPDLIVGHKLTIEGIVAQRAAQILGIPYALSLQGHTDAKILRLRPDLRPRFRAIYHGAAVVFPFAPWTRSVVEDAFGARETPTCILPCATHIDAPLSPDQDGAGFVTVFHLRNARQKNLRGMVTAMEHLAARGVDTTLTVIGGGSAEDVARCTAVTGRSGRVFLQGSSDRDGVRQAMNRAAGFVLPSFGESFGMVFVEALLSGTPIAYPHGGAVSGYFDGMAFAMPVDPRDPASIADAMQRMVEEQIALKAQLAQWQHGEHAHRFSNVAIADTFTQGLRAATGK